MDSRGRVRTSREQREAILREFEKSGVSAAQFAKLIGVRYSTLAGWIHRRRERAHGGGARAKASRAGGSRLRLLEAIIGPPAPGSVAAQGVVVHLPGGIRLEVSSSTQAPLVAALVRVLQPLAAKC
jgi:hypothetical protein